MPSHRHERVRELLKRAIGEALRRELAVERAGLVSVNDLQLSGDLRQATVFVSVLGTAEQKKTGLACLQEARFRIQDLVAKAVVLKYTPRLRFMADDSVARGDRVLKILEEIEPTLPPTT
jgi:ribosome-binding factor A